MIKFYDIDEKYVKYLQTIDSQVPDIHYSTNNKFVCGVVLHVGDFDYYAPISHMNIKQRTNFLIYDKGKPISSIRFSFMVPAFKEVIQVKNFYDIAKYDKNYANLLNSEYKYCKSHEQEILKRALAVYNIGCNKNHKLNYTCCDFKNLESASEKYKNQLTHT